MASPRERVGLGLAATGFSWSAMLLIMGFGWGPFAWARVLAVVGLVAGVAWPQLARAGAGVAGGAFLLLTPYAFLLHGASLFVVADGGLAVGLLLAAVGSHVTVRRAGYATAGAAAVLFTVLFLVAGVSGEAAAAAVVAGGFIVAALGSEHLSTAPQARAGETL